MSKLWIVHRSSRRRDVLAHLSGLAAPDLASGSPTDAAFASATPPAAVLLGLEGDFELELDFLHRHRDALTRSRRFFLTTPQDVAEVRRLFAATDPEILDQIPSDRGLRGLVLSAVSHRNAEPLAARRERERVSQRFTRWFGDLEIPGLLRALDPALARLPLLVRGVPGSGRSLLARYAELFRGASGPVLRVDARELKDIEELAERLRERERAGLPNVRTVWVDEVDACSPGVQHALAEWIRLDAAPAGSVGGSLRWVATAAPRGLHDRLEADLERAFAPLELAIPPIIDQPDALAGFAERVAADWTSTVGGVPRRIDESTFAALEAEAWSGDRAAVEALLRSTFASSASSAASAGAPAIARDRDRQASVEESDLDAHAGSTLGAENTPPTPTDRVPVEDASFLDDTAPDSAPDPTFDPTQDLTSETFDRAAHLAESHPPDAHPMADFPDEAFAAATHVPRKAPAAPVEDFERAFEEGLPASGAAPGAAPGATAGPTAGPRDEAPAPQAEAPSTLDPSLDPSAQLSDEAFEVARTGEIDSPVRTRAGAGRDSWRRLARSLSHEIRNPLVSIRTFTELLPEHFGDESFRERFTELVGRDVAHIDEVVSRLADAAAPEKLEAGPVDVSALLERLLEARRERIGRGRLLVLRELEREAPVAWADPHALEVALAGLLDRALAALPERGDLFVATRRIERSADGTPRIRVLLRHHSPEQSELGAADRSGLEEISAGANVLEYVLAETVVEASGGTLTIDSTDAQETLILVDLLTQSPERG